MKGGRIVEKGKFSELIEDRTEFSKLYQNHPVTHIIEENNTNEEEKSESGIIKEDQIKLIEKGREETKEFQSTEASARNTVGCKYYCKLIKYGNKVLAFLILLLFATFIVNNIYIYIYI